MTTGKVCGQMPLRRTIYVHFDHRLDVNLAGNRWPQDNSQTPKPPQPAQSRRERGSSQRDAIPLQMTAATFHEMAPRMDL